MMTSRLFYFILLCTFCRPLFSQPASYHRTFEEFLEVMVEKQGEGDADEAFIEDLQKLHQYPIMINTANQEELLKIPFLNEVTASALLGYRRRFGKFFSVFELTSVPGIDRALAEKVAWFISVEEDAHFQLPDTLKRKKGFHELLSRTRITFPYAAGYRNEGEKPPAYAGNPLSMYTKYSYERKDFLSVVFQGDKDPGETFFRGTNRLGFDYYSGHASILLKGIIRRVTVGDFTVRTGQGLVCWQGFSMGKSAEVMQASRNMTQVNPYSSSDETQFFRGAAVSGRYRNLSAHLFFSTRRSDGNLTVDEKGVKKVTSLQTSGYHRTGSEIEDEKSVRHTVAGAIFTLYNQKFKAGLTSLVERFGFPFDPGDQLYERFYFRGRLNFNLSADYHWINGRYHLFGEAAVSASGGTAVVQGIEAELHDQLKATLLFRNFGKKYQTTWGSAFGAGSAVSSETGWYAGLRLLPARGISLSAWADWFYFPWIKYGTASPVRGNDMLLQADIAPNRRLSGYVRYKTSHHPDKVTSGKIYGNREVNTGNLRIHSKFDIRNLFSFTWRFECSGIGKNSAGSGILCFQDFAWTPEKIPVSAVMRISWFRIPLYENRIYAYENDLLYSFSTFSFFGNGFRGYIRTKIELNRAMELWLKTGFSWYPDQEITGTGTAEKTGNILRDVKIQIRYRF